MIGAVVIGRNEGQRLVACLASLSGLDRIVYVDSGSTDGSVEMARSRGVDVVSLDMSKPFTAARARNAGLDRLKELGIFDFVQFVDGDCEVSPDWIANALGAMTVSPDRAVICGRRREGFPDATIYNAQCDREWNTPVGQARACGGDALMRISALDAVGGYNPALIAGEEPELCVRLRKAGWTIWRIDAEMTLHDAAMTRFSQFWKRARRAGHAFAQGAWLHGAPPERHYVTETRRAVLWGIVIPLVILAVTVLHPLGLLLLLVYPLQVLRLARHMGLVPAGLLTISKFAEATGVAEFHLRRLFGKPAGLIEYK